MKQNNILIFAELTQNFNVRPVVFQLLTKASSLKTKLENSKIIACLITANKENKETISDLESFGADEIAIYSDEKLKDYNNSYYPEIFTKCAQLYTPSIILIGATQAGKEIASYTSTKLETGLTADCTNIDINEEGKLVSTRPTFGGQLTAEIMCKTLPQMATVQENTFLAKKIDNKAAAVIVDPKLDEICNKIEIIKTEYKTMSSGDISTSQIVVSIGSGACSEEGFRLIKELAAKLDAAIGGSREAFEKGYITKSQQIGQTGKTVAPKLYIAIGISGANQHLTGIKNSGKIIAINKDKEASIFQHADIGIVGDLFAVLPEMIKRLDIEKKEE